MCHYLHCLLLTNSILSQIMFLRKTYGSRLNIFSPINDLSDLSKSGSEGRALVAGQKNDVAITGGQILGDEYSDHVVKVRPTHDSTDLLSHHRPST